MLYEVPSTKKLQETSISLRLCVLPAAVGLCEKKIRRCLPTVGRRTRNSAINPTQIKQKAMGTEGYFLN